MTLARLLPALLAVSVAGAGCNYPTPPPMAPLDGSSLARFALVEEGVYRSAQPTPEQMQDLAKNYRLRTVIKLNVGSDPAPPGVRVIAHPLSPVFEPSPDELERILADIDKAEKPVLIHCTHGEDRTGLVVALYRIRHGVPLDTAYTDMMRRGFHPYQGLWRAWMRAANWTEAQASR